LTLISGPDAAKNEWVKRTNTGVTLTHEIKPHTPYYANSGFYTAFHRLLDFGYGKPETRTWNYWDADFPLRVEGSETSSLVVSKPGSAVIIVCDYGSGGDMRLTLNSALGLGVKFTAKDMESNEVVAVAEGGKITFPLKKHDYRMILVEAAK
jgi:hypothetical protein